MNIVKRMLRSHKRITLVELLIVFALLGVLAAVLIHDVAGMAG